MTERQGEYEPTGGMPARDAIRQHVRVHDGRIDSERLLGSGREIILEHAGEEYRLRQTRNGGLLLTK